jgi:hypothetical protein
LILERDASSKEIASAHPSDTFLRILVREQFVEPCVEPVGVNLLDRLTSTGSSSSGSS